MFINITISSKDLNSLNLFLIFFFKLLKSKSLKIKIFKKVKPVLKKKKSFTVLKSPHVNKTAQEQFKYELFNYKLYIHSFQLTKILFIIKQINIKVASNINILLTFFFNKRMFSQNPIEHFNFDKYSFNLTNYLTFSTTNYLEILSFYGEKKFKVNTKNCSAQCLNSSVGRAKD